MFISNETVNVKAYKHKLCTSSIQLLEFSRPLQCSFGKLKTQYSLQPTVLTIVQIKQKLYKINRLNKLK